jgi:hypothetical protein
MQSTRLVHRPIKVEDSATRVRTMDNGTTSNDDTLQTIFSGA